MNVPAAVCEICGKHYHNAAAINQQWANGMAGDGVVDARRKR